MAAKETLIELIERELIGKPYLFKEYEDEWSEIEACWNSVKEKLEKVKESDGAITENGRMVISFMKLNSDLFGNNFTAKQIGEGIDKQSRFVSGVMKKLITDGYCSKQATNPITYSLTAAGKTLKFDI